MTGQTEVIPQPENGPGSGAHPGPGLGRERRQERPGRSSMAGRIALLTTGVAVVAILIAGLLSYGLVRQAVEAEARTSLSRQADLVADGGLRDRGARVPARLVPALRSQGIQLVRVTAGGDVRGGNAPARTVVDPYATRLANGSDVSAVERTGGETYLVEGRPLGNGSAIALVQPRNDSRAFGRLVLGRTVIALVVGLVVAALAGVWLARRFARPLRRTATAAHQLAGGARQIRVPVDGPAEVAEVAVSLNTLAAALEVSEGRQREFLLSVSHELRTPLTAIKGFAESLSDGVVSGDETQSVGAIMLAEANRLERLVTDLLDLARLGAQDFRIDLTDVDLTALVAAAADVWRARCDAEGVAFSAALPSAPVVVRTDPTRVRQILDGLAENALRVTPAGRPIVFALGGDTVWAALEVRDGGPGLTPDDLAVAFERSVLFERYRGVRKVGTGVGLALARGLALRLGGQASADRAPEGGARFVIWLPVSGPPDQATTQRIPRLAPAGGA